MENLFVLMVYIIFIMTMLLVCGAISWLFMAVKIKIVWIPYSKTLLIDLKIVEVVG